MSVHVRDHEKKRQRQLFASRPMRPLHLSVGGPIASNLPSASLPDVEISTGAALGQDGSYILASDRLPEADACLDLPDLGLRFHPWPLPHGYKRRTL
jgi:hypothetical protein